MRNADELIHIAPLSALLITPARTDPWVGFKPTWLCAGSLVARIDVRLPSVVLPIAMYYGQNSGMWRHNTCSKEALLGLNGVSGYSIVKPLATTRFSWLWIDVSNHLVSSSKKAPLFTPRHSSIAPVISVPDAMSERIASSVHGRHWVRT